MARARAIVKRRKAVRNICKITRTMQMIATARFKKALNRALGSKPYTFKLGELVHELADAVGEAEHPLLRQPGGDDLAGRVALVVITSNRGLAGSYNSSILRAASAFIGEHEGAGRQVDLHVFGKKGLSFFHFLKRPVASCGDTVGDPPRYAEVERLANPLLADFAEGRIDGLHVAYMDFVSASVQHPEVLTLLPLKGARHAADHIATEMAEQDRQAQAMQLVEREASTPTPTAPRQADVPYEFSPPPRELLNDLLPQTVKMALFQCFLDAATGENAARMVAMKSATDNADKMVKALTMQYNRARQSQITTELSEIMGGVEAIKG